MPDRILVSKLAAVAEAILPEEELQMMAAVRGTIRPDATMRPEAVGQAAQQTATLQIIGTAAVGTDVATNTHLPQAAVIDRVLAYAKTAPSGGEFTAVITANGVEVTRVTIPAGTTSNPSIGVNTPVTANAVLGANVTAANGAADVALSVIYRVV